MDFHFLGEKNGRKTGKKYCIAVRNVGGIKLGVRSKEFSVSVAVSVAVTVFSHSFQFSTLYLSPITIKYE